MKKWTSARLIRASSSFEIRHSALLPQLRRADIAAELRLGDTVADAANAAAVEISSV